MGINFITFLIFPRFLPIFLFLSSFHTESSFFMCDINQSLPPVLFHAPEVLNVFHLSLSQVQALENLLKIS